MLESPIPGRQPIVESSDPISALESVRLSRLHALAVLDSAPEPVFDDLVQAACELCGTPMALVSLVDAERLWFKASVGLPQISQVPRESSFCAQAIGQASVMTVQDARLDARFAAHSLVAGAPCVRFYAGAPIVLSDGLVMGTLCVMDLVPRRLGARQCRTLAALARIAASALEARERATVPDDTTGRKRAERELRESEARYRTLVEGQRELVSISTRAGVLSFVNDAYARFFGRPAPALIGMSLLEQVSESERPALAERLRRVFEMGQITGGEEQLRDSQGQWHWIEWNNRPVTDEDGRVIGMHAVGRDVSERRQVERRLAENRELLQVTLDSIGDGVITTDAQGRVQWLNPVAELLTGYTKAEAEGRSLTEVFTLVEEDGGHTAANPVTQCLARGHSVERSNDKILVSRDGVEYGITDNASPIRDAQGALLGAVLVFHDTTEQRRMSREISHRARHDALTGLYNRTEFEQRLGRLLARAEHEGGHHALLFLDLDQFKLVNDACGHSAGDLLLRQVSALLQSSVHGRDTVARLGGDEFGMLLEQCDVRDAGRLAQSICDRMEAYRFVHDDRSFRVGASIGLVPLSRGSLGPVAAMQAADTACYAAKEAGRNRVQVWLETDLAMRARGGETQWAARIEQALDEGRFVLFAQRIEAVGGGGGGDDGGAAAGQGGLHAEALLRMVDLDGSLVLPGAFLPAAERFHLSSRIDRWVLRHACDWLLARQDLSLIETLCVNLSGKSIDDRFFHTQALEMLAAAGPEVCRCICLEITETSAVTSLADAALFIEQVRRLGVRIALDDFGAGASSFGYLKTLAVDMLKIDGQFIRGLLDDPLDDVAVRCFVDVARVRGLKTVAEFVDRPELLQRLREIGVDYAQGFLLHQPEPLDSLDKRVGLPAAGR